MISLRNLALAFMTLSLAPAGTLVVSTKVSRPFNDMLLGLNCNWPENKYGSTGFNNSLASPLIKSIKPTALRWPHGVWANFYDWESDGRRLNDSYKTPYNEAVLRNPKLQYGFEGFKALHDELKFNVLFTWNINYDSPEKGARRFLDRREKGFQIKWVELGNETFWKTQRSDAVSDIHKYIAVSKAHAAALKKIDPTIKVSINATWREPLTSEWNLELAKENYFDAVTLHKYISHPETPEGQKLTLDSRREMITTAETMQKVFPGRPIWLSEWAIESGENAASVLATADTYLGLISRPDLFEIASYFQINAQQALIKFDPKTKSHTRTSFAASYEILREAFEGSTLLDGQLSSPDLSAQAVLKDGNIIVIAINKSLQSSPLNLSVDGKPLDPRFHHQTLAFENLEDFKTFAMDESPLSEVPSDKPRILLPPLSINRIELAP